MMHFEMPVGFRFHPTANELIQQYLPQHIERRGTWDWIAVKELYGPSAVPENVFAGDFHDASPYWVSKKERGSFTERTAYVLTKLTRPKPNTNRFLRRAGSGTWAGQNAEDVKDGSGNVVGRTSSYKYKYDGNNGGPTEWSMREYSLSPNSATKNSENFVICKITKKSKTRPADQSSPQINPQVTLRQTQPPPQQLTPAMSGWIATQQQAPQSYSSVVDDPDRWTEEEIDLLMSDMVPVGQM